MKPKIDPIYLQGCKHPVSNDLYRGFYTLFQPLTEINAMSFSTSDN